jgi:isopropylmalate/homocitrate/citramalate synthase
MGYFAIFGTPKLEKKEPKKAEVEKKILPKEDDEKTPLKKLDEEIKKLEDKGKSKETTHELIKPALERSIKEHKPFIPRVNKVENKYDVNDVKTKEIIKVDTKDVDVKFDEFKFDEIKFDNIDVK